ncbi:hypothetical protein KKA85_06580, partial [bacterium]|nr:hypothetical protein [bacterium]
MRNAITLLVILAAAGPAWAGDTPAYTHQEYFEHYEGTVTCLECHREEAEAFFHSQHYQWTGETPDIVAGGGRRLGKLNTMNDFCTGPGANWIGNVTNSQGKVLAQGCSKCHAGLGLRPEPTLSQEQLENIDCLICHADGYRRDLYDDAAGTPEWQPILWRNQYGLDAVSKRISMPKRKMCLRCHSGAGGGPNFKRGDIEYALAECDRAYDVHMGADGGDMACADCHAGEDHRVRGRGADLSGTDAPGPRLSCEECHEAAPHGTKVLDHHATRIACAACHIPTFARTDPTDMSRDWSTPVYHEDADKYSATIVFESDVTPAYAWWNGRTRHQLMGEAVKVQQDGTVHMMSPEGSQKDKQARIHPFKLHRGCLPVLADRRWLVPIGVEEFFADGDMDKAVHEGGHHQYGLEDFAYDWVDTRRWMGIFHGVVPKERALACLDCHVEGGRMDWVALGYREDP